jgi:hypothetical protein
MNPVDWLKALYETFGTPHPRVSLYVVTILGAAVAFGIWLFAAKQVEKDRQTIKAPPSEMSGPASTTGDQSPAVTGNGNDIRYDQPPPPKKKPESPK